LRRFEEGREWEVFERESENRFWEKEKGEK
jgi:hypothetical protein